MSPAEVLRAARAKLEDPERWAQGWFALDATKVGCEPTSPRACSWCLLGALEVVGWRDPQAWHAARAHVNSAVPDGMPAMPATFNDMEGRTHADVLAVLDRAIAAAEASS